ncbi:MAG: response regulator [Pseudomonadota bacterium]
MDDLIDQEILEAYRDEISERTVNINNGFIQLVEEPGNRDLIEQLLRDAHTLKGSSNLVGLSVVGAVFHKMEDIITDITNGRVEAASVSTWIFDCCDIVKLYVEAQLRQPKDEEAIRALEEKVEGLKTFAGAPAPVKNEAEAGGDWKKEQEPALAPKPHESGPAPRPTVRHPPQKESTEPGSSSKSDLRDVKIRESAIRVSVAKLERLNGMIGEMVFNKIQFQELQGNTAAIIGRINDCIESFRLLEDGIAGNVKSSDAMKENIKPVLRDFRSSEQRLLKEMEDFTKKFREYTDSLDMNIQFIHDASISLRMQPIASVFSLMPRVIFEISQECRKKVEYRIEGKDTEVDIRLLEIIKDPLIHLLRNAISHGIESSEERRREGKPQQGFIELTAYQKGSYIYIEVSDDGRGLDPARLRSKAVELGILREEQSEMLTDPEAVNLIFKTGFSTVTSVTSVSGRGVGMDVVKRNLKAMGGNVFVESLCGRGTKFILMIPITVMLKKVMLLATGGQVFSIPMESIDFVAYIDRETIKTSGSRQIISLRDRILPVARLDELLGLEQSDRDQGQYSNGMVVRYLNEELVLIVDEIIGESEVVLKQLEEPIKRAKFVSGVTTLESSEPVVILNPEHLIEKTKAETFARFKMTEEPETVPRERKRILLVEDSMTTSELERQVLASCGYEVTQAYDGEEAISKLERQIHDIIITDIKMPRMDGYAMIEKLRSDARYKNLPIIVVSSLDSEEEKQKGYDLGANAYITKQTFNQGDLIKLIERLS